MKISDAVFEFLLNKGVNQCFAVTGGAAAHLFDSVSKFDINVTHLHHEQSCAMAADGYARLAKKPAVVLVTNGPGVSNAITGVLGAFQDSIPMIVISGQVSSKQMLKNGGGVERQFGVQEVETAPLVESIVKNFVSVSEASELESVLNESWEIATSGRPGPVWIEIPLDIQSQQVSHVEPISLIPRKSNQHYEKFKVLLQDSLKPLIVLGGGVHTSSAEIEAVDFARKTGIPVVSTWGAIDVFSAQDELYIGNFGILGTRISNYAVQKADLLLILGSRLSIPNTGYATELFSPHSIKVMVNIDPKEMFKKSIEIDLAIETELKQWLSEYPFSESDAKEVYSKWRENLKELDKEFGLSKEEFIHEAECIDSYEVIEKLSAAIENNATLVTDMGTSFTCTMQAFRNLNNSRVFTSSGTSSMGFGLPGAIGAFFADKSRPIYLIAGDGGLQMNIQELQTVKFHKIPLRIIVLNSNGYLAISIMQNNSFEGNYVGSNPESGIDAPDFCKVANAYGIQSFAVESIEELEEKFALLDAYPTAVLFEVKIPNAQLMRPRSQSLRRNDGTFYSNGLEVMWPYLDESEVKKIENSLNLK
jgi:acetolactate synthase I/II/III large subunit